MKLPRPSPELTVEEVEKRICRWREFAGAHRGDPQLYALDHDHLNELLDDWERVRPIPYG